MIFTKSEFLVTSDSSERPNVGGLAKVGSGRRVTSRFVSSLWSFLSRSSLIHWVFYSYILQFRPKRCRCLLSAEVAPDSSRFHDMAMVSSLYGAKIRSKLATRILWLIFIRYITQSFKSCHLMLLPMPNHSLKSPPKWYFGVSLRKGVKTTHENNLQILFTRETTQELLWEDAAMYSEACGQHFQE